MWHERLSLGEKVQWQRRSGGTGGGSFQRRMSQRERPVGQEVVLCVTVASGLVQQGQGDVGICKLQGYDLHVIEEGFLARLSYNG